MIPEQTKDNSVSMGPAPIEDEHKTIRSDAKRLSHPSSQSEADFEQWEIGKRLLDDYVVTSILGRGGMGVVYRVDHQVEDRLYSFAVKTLQSTCLADDNRRRLFLRELRMWAELPEHPHLTACRFFRTIEDRLGIFAEYVDGGSLATWIRKRRPMPLHLILDIAIQFAWGLEAAHRYGMIHQDVKPANVLMTADGIAKVTDFGQSHIIRFRHSDDRGRNPNNGKALQTTGMTPCYCSPEQGLQQKVTFKTDIWSFGVSALEMLTGGVTWSLGAVAPRVLEQLLVKKRSSALEAERCGLVNILFKCFQENPDDRWKTMDELAVELASAYARIAGRPHSRQKPAAPEKIFCAEPTFVRKNYRGIQWRNPQEFLEIASEIAGGKPYRSANHSSNETGSQASQSLSDLEIYEQARYELERLAQNGSHEAAFRLAQLNLNKALVHEDFEDLPGASALLNQAIEILNSSPISGPIPEIEYNASLAKAYEISGAIRIAMGDYSDALQFFTKSNILREKNVSITNAIDAKLSLADNYSGKSAIYLALHSYDNAIGILDRPIRLLQDLEFEQSRPVVILKLASLYMNQGVALNLMKKYDSAVLVLDRSIELRETAVFSNGDKSVLLDLAFSYTNKGISLRGSGDSSGALHNYDRAIEILEPMVNVQGQNELANDLAKLYLNKAVSIAESGDPQSALNLFDRAIKIREKLVYLHGRTDLLNSLGNLFMNQAIMCKYTGDLKAASTLFDKSISIQERLVYQQGRKEFCNDLARVYINKAEIIHDSCDINSEIMLYEKAIAIRESLVRNENQMNLYENWMHNRACLALLRKSHGGVLQARMDAKSILSDLSSDMERLEQNVWIRLKSNMEDMLKDLLAY